MSLRRHRPFLLGTGAIVLLTLLVWFLQPTFVQRIDGMVYDMHARAATAGALSGEVVIVDIDEASLQRYGRWPWPRAVLADLVSRIQAAGASVIALDVVFAEPEQASSPPGLRVASATDASTSAGKKPSLSSPPEARSPGPESSGDQRLSGTIQKGRVVLGHYFRFETIGPDERDVRSPECLLHPVSIALVSSDADQPEPFFRAEDVVCSLASLSQGAVGSGFLNASTDADGVMRRIPLLIAFKDRVYPSLALAAVMAQRGVRTVRLQQGAQGLDWLQVGGVRVPVQAEVALSLRFQGVSGTIPHFSAVSVDDNASAFRDKIVVVGGAAVGLTDAVTTPLGVRFPGAEIHATAVENLLSGNAFSRSPNARLAELGLILGGALLSAFCFLRFGPIIGAVAVVSVAVLIWTGTALVMSERGEFASPAMPLFVLVAVTGIFGLLHSSAEGRRAARSDASAEAARQFMVAMLASVAKERDVETGDHLLRMQRYTLVLAVALASHPRFRDVLTPENIPVIAELVAIHDVGKLAIPAEILHKPGSLTESEYEIVKMHVARGRDALEAARVHAQAVDPRIYEFAWQVVCHHHERWDGSGYPEGLCGEEISPVGRMVALVDVYDALVHNRVYKAAIPHPEALKIIEAERSKHFDPAVVDAFLRAEEAFARITADSPEHGNERSAAG